MKQITSLVFFLFLLLGACGEDKKPVVCTKDECCCPDSLAIDIWDHALGLHASKPVVLSGNAKWDVINFINEAEYVGFMKNDPEYVIRAWYVGSINPRVFRIHGSYVRDDYQDWYDTGVEDFGKRLYEGLPLDK